MAIQSFNCPRCGVPNAHGVRFCSNCGLQFTPRQPLPNAQKNKSSLYIVLAILGGFFMMCVLCGVIGNLSKNKNDAAVSSTSANLAAIPTASPTPTPPPTFAELRTRAEDFLKIKPENLEYADVERIDDTRLALQNLSKEDKNYKEAQLLTKKLIDRTAPVAAEKFLLGDKPKSSSYDGRVQPAVDYLRANLNDYDSCEFVNWYQVVKTTYEKKPAWGVKLRLRAKNAFGAFIVKDVFFYIRQNQVVGVEGL